MTRESQFEIEGQPKKKGLIKWYGGFYADKGKPVGGLIDCVNPECDNTIHIHFRKDLKPHWEFDFNMEYPTIVPEIKCKTCGTVFMIDEGKAVMA